MTESVPTRGSLRSRSAALVSMTTLRQVSAVLPPEQAWGLWVARRIIAGIVDPAHRRLKLDVAGGPPFPPTLIQAGGGRCTLQVWPDQVHVFQALPSCRRKPSRP